MDKKYEQLREMLHVNKDKKINPYVVLGWMEDIDEQERVKNKQLAELYSEQALNFSYVDEDRLTTLARQVLEANQ